MNSRLIAQIAFSLLAARWKQTFVAAIGVTFSIAMFIALLSFMAGLNELLDGLMLNRTPHIRLYNDIKPNPNQPVNLSTQYSQSYNFIRSIKSSGKGLRIRNSGAILEALNADDRVLGIAPKIVAPVFFNDAAVDITGAVIGLDVLQENKLYFFGDYVTEGRLLDLKDIANSVILGKGVAAKLLAEVGDVIQVTTVKGERIPLKVVGIYRSGIQELDNIQCYASIATAQKLLGEANNYITDIQVNLKNMETAPAVAKEYAMKFDTDAEDIQTANAQFETGSFVRTLISYAVGITLLIVAGFGIYNILNMMIFEKMDAIAILKATGFSGKDVKRIFLTIALGIGIFGGILGLIFGWLASFGIDQIPFETESLPNIKTYPISYNPSFYLIGGIFSLITTFFAGFFPAQKASSVDPVVIIRGK